MNKITRLEFKADIASFTPNIIEAAGGSSQRSNGHLTHWGWVTHICVGKLSIIGSDNGLPPGWRQAIIWTNAGI